jgi:hypothetical protein
MPPLQSILEFLLSGVSRIPDAERTDALCSIFAGLLPEMSEADIAAAREQVIARFLGAPDIADPVLDLIDGHVALRTIMRTNGAGPSTGTRPGDYQV